MSAFPQRNFAVQAMHGMNLAACHGVVMSKRQFVVWRLEAIDEVSEDYEHCQRVLTFRLLGFHRDRSKLFRTWLRSWCPGDD